MPWPAVNSVHAHPGSHSEPVAQASVHTNEDGGPPPSANSLLPPSSPVALVGNWTWVQRPVWQSVFWVQGLPMSLACEGLHWALVPTTTHSSPALQARP